MVTYINLLGLIALVVFLRVQLPSAGEGHKADATRVNMNVLLGVVVLLLVLRVILDVASP